MRRYLVSALIGGMLLTGCGPAMRPENRTNPSPTTPGGAPSAPAPGGTTRSGLFMGTNLRTENMARARGVAQVANGVPGVDVAYALVSGNTAVVGVRARGGATTGTTGITQGTTGTTTGGTTGTTAGTTGVTGMGAYGYTSTTPYGSTGTYGYTGTTRYGNTATNGYPNGHPARTPDASSTAPGTTGTTGTTYGTAPGFTGRATTTGLTPPGTTTGTTYGAPGYGGNTGYVWGTPRPNAGAATPGVGAPGWTSAGVVGNRTNAGAQSGATNTGAGPLEHAVANAVRSADPSLTAVYVTNQTNVVESLRLIDQNNRAGRATNIDAQMRDIISRIHNTGGVQR